MFSGFLQFETTNCARPALPAAGPHIDWLQFAQGIPPTCKEVCESQVMYQINESY